MEIRKDFGQRVKALSESTPREAIANLLSALMPRVEARVRPAAQPDWAPTPRQVDPDPLAKLMPLRQRRAPRTRRAMFRRYTVVSTYIPARTGTKRYHQTKIVLDHTDTRAARLAGAENCDFDYAVQCGLIKYEEN